MTQIQVVVDFVGLKPSWKSCGCAKLPAYTEAVRGLGPMAQAKAEAHAERLAELAEQEAAVREIAELFRDSDAPWWVWLRRTCNAVERLDPTKIVVASPRDRAESPVGTIPGVAADPLPAPDITRARKGVLVALRMLDDAYVGADWRWVERTIATLKQVCRDLGEVAPEEGEPELALAPHGYDAGVTDYPLHREDCARCGRGVSDPIHRVDAPADRE
jgi:hypothetical protein